MDIANQAEISWCLNSSETEFVVGFFQLKLIVMMMAKTLWGFRLLVWLSVKNCSFDTPNR